MARFANLPTPVCWNFVVCVPILGSTTRPQQHRWLATRREQDIEYDLDRGPAHQTISHAARRTIITLYDPTPAVGDTHQTDLQLIAADTDTCRARLHAAQAL